MNEQALKEKLKYIARRRTPPLIIYGKSLFLKEYWFGSPNRSIQSNLFLKADFCSPTILKSVEKQKISIF